MRIQHPNSLRNLKVRKKGCPALPGAGRPKGSKNVRTILDGMLRRDPEVFLLLIGEDASYAREAKKRGIRTVKDLMIYRLIHLAIHDDREAMKIIFKELGESSADRIEVDKKLFSPDLSNFTDEELALYEAGELTCGQIGDIQARGRS